jgi:hypothetical protein
MFRKPLFTHQNPSLTKLVPRTHACVGNSSNSGVFKLWSEVFKPQPLQGLGTQSNEEISIQNLEVRNSPFMNS